MKVMTSTDGSSRDVAARKVTKHFAVHRSVFGEGWTVTHILTGYFAVDGCSTRDMAMRAARRFERLKRDWAFTDPTAALSWTDALAVKKSIERQSAKKRKR